jgi:hypothetical protein
MASISAAPAAEKLQHKSKAKEEDDSDDDEVVEEMMTMKTEDNTHFHVSVSNVKRMKLCSSLLEEDTKQEYDDQGQRVIYVPLPSSSFLHVANFLSLGLSDQEDDQDKSLQTLIVSSDMKWNTTPYRSFISNLSKMQLREIQLAAQKLQFDTLIHLCAARMAWMAETATSEEALMQLFDMTSDFDHLSHQQLKRESAWALLD